MAAHEAPPSLGFSRQEHWSGLPFPSPMHESEKKVKSLSRVRLLVTPWTATYQAPPSTASSRQEYWSGVPLPSPKDFTRCLYFVIWVITAIVKILRLKEIIPASQKGGEGYFLSKNLSASEQAVPLGMRRNHCQAVFPLGLPLRSSRL